MGKVNIDKSDLGHLGLNYQNSLVKILIEDSIFFNRIVDILNQNLFTEENLRFIVSIIKEIYSKNKAIATYDTIETLIRYKKNDEISLNIALETLKKIQNLEVNAHEQVKELALDFFKQQNLTIALNKVYKIIGKGVFGKYEEIEKIVLEALKENNPVLDSEGVFENVEDVLSQDEEHIIPTQSRELNDKLGGGIIKGSVGVIIAPTGVGKTSITTGMSAYASTFRGKENDFKGYKVIHIFFEDSYKQIKRKYLSFLSDTEVKTLIKNGEAKDLINAFGEGELKENKELIEKNVKLYKLNTGEHTVSWIEKNIIQKNISEGFTPDLVIIDYFECLKHERNSNGLDFYKSEAVTMRKIENVASNYNLAIWVPIQGTKGSVGAEKVGSDKGGGAFEKIQIASVVIGLARTNEQETKGTINISINKNRNVRLGYPINDIPFNNGTCRFQDRSQEEVESSEKYFSVNEAVF